MTQEDLIQLLQQYQQESPQQKPHDLGWGLNKLTSTLSGIGSIPDVMYNTNNPIDILTMGPRYVGNILSGLAGSMVPWMDAPEFKMGSDVMKKHNITSGNEVIDMLGGLGIDLATDPTMYAGTGALLKGRNLLRGIGKEGVYKTAQKMALQPAVMSNYQILKMLGKVR